MKRFFLSAVMSIAATAGAAQACPDAWAAIYFKTVPAGGWVRLDGYNQATKDKKHPNSTLDHQANGINRISIPTVWLRDKVITSVTITVNQSGKSAQYSLDGWVQYIDSRLPHSNDACLPSFNACFYPSNGKLALLNAHAKNCN